LSTVVFHYSKTQKGTKKPKGLVQTEVFQNCITTTISRLLEHKLKPG